MPPGHGAVGPKDPCQALYGAIKTRGLRSVRQIPQLKDHLEEAASVDIRMT